MATCNLALGELVARMNTSTHFLSWHVFTHLTNLPYQSHENDHGDKHGHLMRE